MLEAVAAALPEQKLVLDAGKIDPDPPAQGDVQVLERDRDGMRTVQPAQGPFGGFGRTSVADALLLGSYLALEV